MAKDAEEEAESKSDSYRDTLFAHAFVSQNPELFESLYPEIFGTDESELEWITDPNEFETFLSEHFPDGIPQ